MSERLGKEQDAIEYCQRALRIAERQGFPDHHPIVRELRKLYAVLSERDPEESVQESYELGLAAHNDEDYAKAIPLLLNGWERRTELDREYDVRWMALASGVWLCVYQRLIADVDVVDPDVVYETVDPEVESLSPAARILFEVLFADRDFRIPDDLHENIDTSDPTTELERNALESIIEALSS